MCPHYIMYMSTYGRLHLLQWQKYYTTINFSILNKTVQQPQLLDKNDACLV